MSWKKILMEGDAAVLSDTVPDDVKKQSANAGTAVEAARQDHKHNLDLSASGLNELGVPTGAVDMNSQRVTSIGTPTTAGDAVGVDANLRVPDSVLLEGSTKAQVQNHTPAAHASEHKNSGGDELLLNELGEPTGSVNFNKQEAVALVFEQQSTAPGTPTQGQAYYDTDDDHVYVYVAA